MIKAPKTKAEAEAYRYFRWAGNPRGIAYDPRYCAFEVWESGRGCRAWQCSNKPKAGPDNLYCKMHAKKLAAT